MSMRRRFALFLAVLTLSCAATAIQAGEPMRYQFKAMTDVTYRVEATIELPAGRFFDLGYLVVSVLPLEGDGSTMKLRLTGNSVTSALRGGDKTAPVAIGDVAYPVVSASKELGANDVIITRNGSALRTPSATNDPAEAKSRISVPILLPRLDPKGGLTWENVVLEKGSGLSSNTPVTMDEVQSFALRERVGSLQNMVWNSKATSREKLGDQPLLFSEADYSAVFDVDRGLITKGHGRFLIVERLAGGKTYSLTADISVTLLTPEEVEKNKAEYAARQADLKQRLAAAKPPPAPRNDWPQGDPPPARRSAQDIMKEREEERVRKLREMREQAESAQDRSDPKPTRTTFRSKQVGSTDGSAFVNSSPTLEPVVGFRYELSNWAGKSVLRKLEPVYERPKDKPDSGYIGAREGYFVAGVIVSSSEFANGFRVIFAKMNEGRIDTKTTYFSDWVGKPQGDAETKLGNNGALVVGVFGTHGMNVHGFGLVQAGEPNPPTAAELEKAKKKEALIDTYWQQPKAKTTDLLPDMPFNGSRNADGTIALRSPGQYGQTIPRYVAPATFRIVLQSDGSDLRLGYAAEQVIFNWEANPNELRVEGGPAHGQHKREAGALPANEWVAIEWVVRFEEMVIYINGKERYRARGDFTSIDQPLTIRAQRGGLTIRSVALVQ